MTVSVYNLWLERIGVIETWVSLVWQECYNTEGSFQLEVRRRSDLLPLLKPEYYCGLTGHDTLMVLKSSADQRRRHRGQRLPGHPHPSTTGCLRMW